MVAKKHTPRPRPRIVLLAACVRRAQKAANMHSLLKAREIRTAN